ncbi:Protein of unknown function [Lactobacillus delbrueckii subsp. bulgaricus]
MVLIH